MPPHTHKILKRTDLQNLARGRLGLIIGPSTTTSSTTFYQDLARNLATHFSVEALRTYHETAEAAVNMGAEPANVQRFIVDYSQQQKPSPLVGPLARLRVSAILSAALDDFLETRIQQELARHPLRMDVSVISKLSDTPRQRTLPIYKLLGSALRNDIVVTTADYLRHVPQWHTLTREYLRPDQGVADAVPGFCGRPMDPGSPPGAAHGAPGDASRKDRFSRR